MKKVLLLTLITVAILVLVGCETPPQPANASQQERAVAQDVQNRLVEAQPMPTDIMASLERHNLIRRAYWINGMRERAMTLPNPVPNPPMGYIILFAPNGGVIGRFLVEGKVTSLNYSLVPYSHYWEIGHRSAGNGATQQNNNRWIANPGGVYGTNTNGIFWFTPDGKYMEWNGTYLFSDIPFIIDDPVLRIEHVEAE